MPRIAESIIKTNKGFFLKMIFGSGITSLPSSSEIDLTECPDGENFDIALDKTTFTRRKAFDKIATATNGEEIRGFVELIKTDGSVTTLVQAGGTIYKWDGATTFTLVGTVNANSRLRGGRNSTDLINDKVIITDLEKADVVKTWDGTTFEDFGHNLGGKFKAKYCLVDDERAFFANVSTVTDTPHLLVSSSRGTLTTIDVTNRPDTSLSAADAWNLPIPDLRPINGIGTAFGKLILSTENGRIWALAGSSADVSTVDDTFRLERLYMGSGAAGVESFVDTGRDIVYGRPGRIESVYAVNTFGNLNADDLTRWVFDQTEKVKSWTLVYNPRNQKIYAWPEDGSEVWVFHSNLYIPGLSAQGLTRQTKQAPFERFGLSPWAKWTTDQGNGDFRQTAAMLTRRATDKLDVVYFGGADGAIYQLEGDGGQDGGDTDIAAYRTSGIIELPFGNEYNIRGYITYQKKFKATATITALWSGITQEDKSITVAIPLAANVPLWNSNMYWGDFYWNAPFTGRLSRQEWQVAGSNSFVQIKVQINGANEFDIDDIGIHFEATN